METPEKIPDKIYLYPSVIEKGTLIKRWFNTQYANNSIEYTRTDAFIEKACNYWYKHNQEMVKRYGSKAILGCSEFTVNIEDFKKYMKGE